MEWSDILKNMKRESGMTTLEISKKCGVPEPTLEKLFSGFTKDPKLSTIRDVVHCLGHTLDDLSPATVGDDPAETSKFNEALAIFKTLRPDFQDYALDQIKKLVELQKKT